MKYAILHISCTIAYGAYEKFLYVCTKVHYGNVLLVPTVHVLTQQVDQDCNHDTDMSMSTESEAHTHVHVCDYNHLHVH